MQKLCEYWHAFPKPEDGGRDREATDLDLDKRLHACHKHVCVTIAYICHIGASQVHIKLRDRMEVASVPRHSVVHDQFSSAALGCSLTRTARGIHLVGLRGGLSEKL